MTYYSDIDAEYVPTKEEREMINDCCDYSIQLVDSCDRLLDALENIVQKYRPELDRVASMIDEDDVTMLRKTPYIHSVVNEVLVKLHHADVECTNLNQDYDWYKYGTEYGNYLRDLVKRVVGKSE